MGVLSYTNAMEMDSGIVIMLAVFFVVILFGFVMLLWMLPEWFGISKKEKSDSSQVKMQAADSSQSDT
jgi:hypothetical protein